MDLISSSGGKDKGPDGKEEFGRYIVSGCHLAMLNLKSDQLNLGYKTGFSLKILQPVRFSWRYIHW